MDGHSFRVASPIKRKPLPSPPRDPRYIRTIGDGSSQGDAIPLVPVDNIFSWSTSSGFHGPDTSYDASRHLDPPEEAPIRESDHVFFSKRNRYSKLSPGPNQQDDAHSVQKSPLTFQNAIVQSNDHQPPPRMWNPICLHSLALAALALLFAALLTGLIILWHFARLENGISTIVTENHYTWTYGPTALLVIIAVALEQVDFHCRILAPWSRLRRGSIPAKNGLLLDYVSPILPKTLKLAAANHEWAVIASGFGILLLRIVVIFSTGLLVLTPVTVSRTFDNAIVNSSFAGVDYDVSLLTEDHELMRYYGVQEQGMEYQYGADADVAYETIDLTSLVPNSTVTATVNGVFPFFDCEIVKPQIVEFSWTDEGEYPLVVNVTMKSTKCPVELLSFPGYCQPTEGGCTPGQYIYSDDEWYSPELPLSLPNESDPCAHLYKVSITELVFERVDGQSANTSAGWNVTLPNITGLICTLGYTVDTMNVTMNTADPISAGGVNTTGPIDRVMDVLPGYSYTNFTQNFLNEVEVNSLPKLPSASNIFDFAHLFAILNNGSAEALLNPDILKSTAERAFKGVGAQIADHVLRKADNGVIKAVASYTEQRLQIRIVSVWAMGVGFVLLSISTMAVLIWRPQDTVSHNPGQIATQVALLAASSSLKRSLAGTGSCSDVQLTRHLSSTKATSRIVSRMGSPTFFLETVSDEEEHEIPSRASDGAGLWWRPMSTRFWFMALAVILPVGVIIALEVLQHVSDAHNGFASISASSLVDHSLPSVLASVLMISIAMMYNALNLTTATLAPYQALQRGSSTARRTLLGTALGDLPLRSSLEAVRNRHASAIIASLAATIGSILTIISSGLYTIENTISASDINLVRSDQFIPSFSTLTDGGAGGVFALIEHNNASYPALTYDELVFPRIALSSLGEEATKQLGDSKSVTIQVSVPAWRAALNCTVVPRDTIIRNNTLPPVAQPDTSCPDSTTYWNSALPETCPHFLDGKNATATEIAFSYDVQHDCSQPGQLELYQGANMNSVNGILDGPDGTTLGAPGNPPGCPSLAFVYGYWVVNSTSTENVTAMTCIQGFEEVLTNTTFVVSQGSFQIKSAPIVDESSARWLSAFNSTYWFTKYGEFDSFNQDGTSPDFFYQQVNDGLHGIPPAELVGPANTDRFVNATQHVYRQFMAQLINSNMRQNLDSTEAAAAPSYPATVLDINVLRLKQNATSKLILQILLGVMVACGIFVYSWQDMRHVLPHCPWSIAGTMSLLAGSELIERKIVPAGAEFMRDKELAKVFEGYLFSLGWWDTDAKTGGLTEKRFGIDIGKADASSGTRGVR